MRLVQFFKGDTITTRRNVKTAMMINLLYVSIGGALLVIGGTIWLGSYAFLALYFAFFVVLICLILYSWYYSVNQFYQIALIQRKKDAVLGAELEANLN